MVQLDNVLVIELLQNLNLTQQARLFVFRQTVHLDLVPSHVHAVLLVERHVHVFVRPAAEKFRRLIIFLYYFFVDVFFAF